MKCEKLLRRKRSRRRRKRRRIPEEEEKEKKKRQEEDDGEGEEEEMQFAMFIYLFIFDLWVLTNPETVFFGSFWVHLNLERLSSETYAYGFKRTQNICHGCRNKFSSSHGVHFFFHSDIPICQKISVKFCWKMSTFCSNKKVYVEKYQNLLDKI